MPTTAFIIMAMVAIIVGVSFALFIRVVIGGKK